MQLIVSDLALILDVRSKTISRHEEPQLLEDLVQKSTLVSYS